MRFRSARIATTALAAALALGACADTGSDEDTPGEQAPDEQADPDTEEPQGDGQDDASADGDDPAGDLGDLGIEDPNEQVEDGEYRGQGIVLPVPDGYELDPGAYMQGVVAAVTESGDQQIAGQSVDLDTLPEPLSLDELIDSNSAEFGEPSLDEDIEVEGAQEARQVRYTLGGQQEGQAELTLLLVAADNGDGRLALFNYMAPSDSYDHDEAQSVLSTVAFDPDSAPEPIAPTPAPEQAPEQAPQP